jgi:hypothetical protein
MARFSHVHPRAASRPVAIAEQCQGHPAGLVSEPEATQATWLRA